MQFSCYAAIRWSLSILAILSLYPSVIARDSGQIAALEEIFAAYPDLSSVPSWAQLTDDGIYYGHSWSRNFTNICLREGYNFYGIYCENNRIVGLRLTEHFGRPLSTSFPAVENLSDLTNYTCLSSNGGDYCSSISRDIIRYLATQIRHLEVYKEVDLSPFYSSNSVHYLHVVNAPSLGLGNFTVVKYLTLLGRSGSSTEPLSWTSISPAVESITLVGSFDSAQFFLNLHLYANLKIMNCDGCNSPPQTGQFAVLPPSLVYIKLVLNPPLVSLGVNSDTLETLIAPGISVIPYAPKLTELTCMSVDGPDGTQLDQIKYLTLESSSISSLEQEVCPLFAEGSVLEHFALSFAAPKPMVFPNCFNQSTLKSLQLHNVIIDGSLFANISSGISSLSLNSFLSSSYSSNFTMAKLLKFTQIRQLSLIDNLIAGTVPPNFFQALSGLENFEITSGSLKGPIPSYGWSNLKTVLIRNGFESWPSLDAAPRLKMLNVLTKLASIPSDDLFRSAGLVSLEDFEVSLLLGSVPSFWTSLPRIRRVSLLSVPGVVPDISAPRLRYLELYAGVRFLCPLLPAFLVPTHLQSLKAGFFGFSGEIPPSWEQKLNIVGTLDLTYNYLSGTIPAHLFDHHSFMADITLNYNFFDGPLWNMSRGAPRNFALVRTHVDLCANMPTPPPGNVVNADIVELEFCPTGSCAVEWVAIDPEYVCWNSTTPYANPCANRASCPDPPPTGFFCINGVWERPGSLQSPSVTVSPGLGTIIIKGNLSTSSVTFTGSSTTLEVEECVLSLDQVVVQMDPDHPPPTQTVLEQKGTNCTTDLRKVPLVIEQTKKSCKESKTSSSESTPSLLVLSFSIDSKKCNTKWIILGCVLGIVAILAVAGVIAFKFFKVKIPLLPQEI